MLDCLELSLKIVFIPFMPILAPGKKSGDTNSNPLPGTLQRLNELIHMKLLKIWKKKKNPRIITATTTAIPLLHPYF